MARIKQIAFICLLVHFMVSCVAQKTSNQPYHESLSEIRPRVTVPPDSSSSSSTTTSVVVVDPHVSFTKTVNEMVDVVLDSIDRFNLTRRSVDGFTIQIYSGQNREEAMNTKKKMTTDLPNLTAILQYQQPKFRVTAGKYYSKLEAYQDLSTLRSVFPAAILVPEKIAIR
jgi:hypothetical protein